MPFYSKNRQTADHLCYDIFSNILLPRPPFLDYLFNDYNYLPELRCSS